MESIGIADHALAATTGLDRRSDKTHGEAQRCAERFAGDVGTISYGDTMLLDGGNVQLSQCVQEASALKRHESQNEVEYQVEVRITERHKTGKQRFRRWRWFEEMKVLQNPFIAPEIVSRWKVEECVESSSSDDDETDDCPPGT
jgi:hypothetical protein